jgi:hypothetical protein
VFDFLVGEARKGRTYTSCKERQQMRKMSMPRLAIHLGVPAIWRLVFTYFRGRRYHAQRTWKTVHAL